MTNEEASVLLASFLLMNTDRHIYGDELNDALDIAIKALVEKEPKTGHSKINEKMIDQKEEIT